MNLASTIASPERRAVTAIHESGHILAAHTVGHRLIAATIEPRAEMPRGIVLGRAVARGELRTRSDRERAVIALLGGAAVEKIAFGRPRWRRASSDVQKAVALLDGDLARIGTLWVATVRIIRAHREQIAAVAQQLVRDGTLDRLDLMKLIGGK